MNEMENFGAGVFALLVGGVYRVGRSRRSDLAGVKRRYNK